MSTTPPAAGGPSPAPKDPGPGGTPEAAPRPSAEAHPTPAGRSVPSSRAGSVWLALAPGLAFLVVVIVFIVENSQQVQVGFFGAHWTLPLGVDLLLAAVLGGLVVFLLGSVRILQLRRVARHHARRGGAEHPTDRQGSD